MDHGEPGQDCSSRPLNPDFVLNDPRYAGAEILLTRHNFGCGSSREHAPWALDGYGFRVLIAPSFADIFRQNAIKNGQLPIVLDEQVVEALFALATDEVALEIEVDLEGQRLQPSHGEPIAFEIDAFYRHCLINGLDDIGLTLERADEIAAYEQRRQQQAPWLFASVASV